MRCPEEGAEIRCEVQNCSFFAHILAYMNSFSETKNMQEPRTPEVETTMSVGEEVSKPSERVIEIVTETFQALGDVTRVKILYALQQRTMCVRELAYQVGV